MLYPVIFISVFLSVSILLLMLKIKILLEYQRCEWNDHLIISFFTLKGIFTYKMEIPLMDLDRKGIRFRKVKEKGAHEEDVENEKGLLRFFQLHGRFEAIKDFYKRNRGLLCDIKDYLRTRLVCKEFKADVLIGAEDAGNTGIISGIAWAVIGIIISYIENTFTLQKRSVTVKPLFNEKKFKVDLYCIFSIRIVHIIVITLKLCLNSLRKKFEIKCKKTIGGGICG